MNYKVISSKDKKYIELGFSDTWQLSERNITDLIAVCWENNTHLLLLHGEVLPEDFFRLGTRVAGEIIQKLVNYHIITAAVIPDELKNKGIFREMALEANKGNQFRIFSTGEEAENWLICS